MTTPAVVAPDLVALDAAFEAHLKTAAWHQVLVQAKDDDDDGASIYRMCRMAAREAWTASAAALAPAQTQGDAEPVAYANPVILLPADEGDPDVEWTAKVQGNKDDVFSLPLYLAAPRAVPESPVPTQPSEFVQTFPDHIWLDAGEAMEFAEKGDTFRDLQEVTWSEDNATGFGVKYIRADLATPAATQAGAEALTDEQIVILRRETLLEAHQSRASDLAFARAIERAHGITESAAPAAANKEQK